MFYLEQNLGSFPQQGIIRAEEIPQCDCPTEESASVHTEAVEGHKAILHWREGCLVWTVSSERKRERERKGERERERAIIYTEQTNLHVCTWWSALAPS